MLWWDPLEGRNLWNTGGALLMSSGTDGIRLGTFGHRISTVWTQWIKEREGHKEKDEGEGGALSHTSHAKTVSIEKLTRDDPPITMI